MKTTLLIAVFLVSCVALRAQDSGTFFLNFDHFALSVKDVDRSANFYTKILKLQELTNRTKMDGIRWMSLGDGKELHLVSILPGQVTVTKAVHLGLKTSKFDEVKKRLDEAKITYSDWPGAISKVTQRADGVRQMYFQDPDGYWIEVNSVGTPSAAAGVPTLAEKP